MSPRPTPGPAPAPALLFARQPICDRDQRTVGFELLFRDDHRTIEDVSAGAATSRVLVAALADVGLDAVVGIRRAWVNVTGDFLLAHDELPLPSERVVLEILEDTVLTAPLMDRLRSLVEEGFVLAADDFVHSRASDPLLDLVSYVKLDLRELGRPGFREHVLRLRDRDVKLLAEKVETADEFAYVRDLGCSLFQGWFYAKPDPVRATSVPSRGPGSLSRVAEVGAGALDIDALEQLVMVDAGLTYRLLRFLNSAFVGPRSEITSIRQALVMLGERSARQWLMLICMADMSAHSAVLLETAIIRARACELLGSELAPARPAQGFFTCGLFSVAEALVGVPFPAALDGLPLSPGLSAAITDHAGPEGTALAAVLAHEAGRRADGVDGVDAGTVATHVGAAIAWAGTLLESMPAAD